MDVLSKAIALAAEVHAGQRHGRGTKIEHCIRVMMQMDTTDEKVVAVLHDVIENSDLTPGDLLACGFDEHLVCSITLLTHREWDDYFTYIRMLLHNDLARKVKLADNQDNGSTLFDSGLSDATLSSLVVRYAKARRILNFEEY